MIKKNIIILGAFCAFLISFSALYVATQKRLQGHDVVSSAVIIEQKLFDQELGRKIQLQDRLRQSQEIERSE